MKVTETKITQLTIEGAKSAHGFTMDPIQVFLEDLGPRRGRITFETFGESWSASWGGMGERTIAEFFVDCNHSYLAGKLKRPGESFSEIDGPAVACEMRQAVIKQRREQVIDEDDARILFNQIESFEDEEQWKQIGSAEYGLLHETLGDDWHEGLPERTSAEGHNMIDYLTAIQAGLRQHLGLQQEAA